MNQVPKSLIDKNYFEIEEYCKKNNREDIFNNITFWRKRLKREFIHTDFTDVPDNQVLAEYQIHHGQHLHRLGILYGNEDNINKGKYLRDLGNKVIADIYNIQYDRKTYRVNVDNSLYQVDFNDARNAVPEVKPGQLIIVTKNNISNPSVLKSPSGISYVFYIYQLGINIECDIVTELPNLPNLFLKDFSEEEIFKIYGIRMKEPEKLI